MWGTSPTGRLIAFNRNLNPRRWSSSPSLHMLTDTGGPYLQPESDPPRSLLVCFSSVFGKCSEEGSCGGAGGGEAAQLDIWLNSGYENRVASQNCRVKHFSLPLFKTAGITPPWRKRPLSSFYATALACIFTGLMFFSKHQHDTLRFS